MGLNSSTETGKNDTKYGINNYENQYSDVKQHISDADIEKNIRNLFINRKLSPYTEYSYMDTLGLNKTNSQLDPIPNKSDVFIKYRDNNFNGGLFSPTSDNNFQGGSVSPTSDNNFNGVSVSPTSDNNFNGGAVSLTSDNNFNGEAVSSTSNFDAHQLNMEGGVNTSDINEILKNTSEYNQFDLNKITNKNMQLSDTSVLKESDTSPFNTNLQAGGNNIFLTTSDPMESSSEFDTTELDIEKFMKSKQTGGKKRLHDTSDEITSYNTEDINVLNNDSTSEIFPRNLNRKNYSF